MEIPEWTNGWFGGGVSTIIPLFSECHPYEVQVPPPVGWCPVSLWPFTSRMTCPAEICRWLECSAFHRAVAEHASWDDQRPWGGLGLNKNTSQKSQATKQNHMHLLKTWSDWFIFGSLDPLYSLENYWNLKITPTWKGKSSEPNLHDSWLWVLAISFLGCKYVLNEIIWVGIGLNFQSLRSFHALFSSWCVFVRQIHGVIMDYEYVWCSKMSSCCFLVYHAIHHVVMELVPNIFPLADLRMVFPQKRVNQIHPGRWTWNLQITHFEREMIFQTSMVMFHVNLQGCINQMRWHSPNMLTSTKYQANWSNPTNNQSKTTAQTNRESLTSPKQNVAKEQPP